MKLHKVGVKAMKKTVSFLMVVFMLGSLCACSQKEEPTTAGTQKTSAETTAQAQTDASAAAKETAQQVMQSNVQTTQEKIQAPTAQEATTAAVQKKKPKISVSELFDANTLSMLLYNYSCVRVVRTTDYGKQTEQYSLLDDEIMQIVKNSPNDEDPYYYGQYGAFYFDVKSDRTKACIMLDDLNSTVAFPFENTIAEIFSDCKASFVKEAEDSYIYKVTYPNNDIDGYEVIVTVRKDTLAVVKAVYQCDGEITQTAKFALNAPVKDYANIISKWKTEKKTVTVIAEKLKGNNKTVKQTELKLPSDWEIVVQDIVELNYYMDKDHTKPYRYPGNGKSYTLYVTNTMG
ncbi:MAG: lipoprotein [Acutalibacteraceae bacterium]